MRPFFALLQYRNSVRKLYDGPAGAALALASLVSLHEPLIGRLLRNGGFRINERKSFLDVGSGAGQIMGHLLRMSSPDARLVSFDLSHPMLKRAEQRLKSDRPISVAGDLMRLPFADESFDFITCGWVIEHLPDPVPGLKEISRVLRPGGSVQVAPGAWWDIVPAMGLCARPARTGPSRVPIRQASGPLSQ